LALLRLCISGSVALARDATLDEPAKYFKMTSSSHQAVLATVPSPDGPLSHEVPSTAQMPGHLPGNQV